MPRSSRPPKSARTVKGKPQVIIANTVPGKGVSYMEGDYTWHGKPPNTEQTTRVRELKADSRQARERDRRCRRWR